MRPGSPAPRRSGGSTPAPSARMAAAMSGAVDLAAVKARSEAAARAADAPPPAAGATVIAVDEAGFQTEVMDRSFQVPVLLDLWAEWCEPCKQLSPLLERLAAEDAGRWILATIDVDANPRIAQALQVQSIPTVFAVIGGQVVPGFQGALPEAQLREFINAVLQAAQEAGLSGGGAPVDAAQGEAAEPEVASDPRFDAAEAALDGGDYDRAVDAFQAILDTEPANSDALLGLRQSQFLRRLSLNPSDIVAVAEADPADSALQLGAADQQFADNDAEGAINRLIALIPRVHGENRDEVRDRVVDYFELLGPDDPLVGPARRRLANALF